MIELEIHKRTTQNIEGYLTKTLYKSDDTLLGFVQNS